MRDGDVADDGVGAVNARSEVVIFTRPLGATPDAFRRRAPDRITLLSRGRPIHTARYGDLVYAAAGGDRPVMVSEVVEGGGVGRMSHVARAGEAA